MSVVMVAALAATPIIAGCASSPEERAGGATKSTTSVLEDAALTAREIARQVKGVKQVYNDIRIVPRS